MEVELPSNGCNIITSSTSFYNYSPDGRTRETYYIYDGKAFLRESTYNQYGYSYTGTCLYTGDLIYKPELQVYFPLISFILICGAVLLIYWCIFKRLLK